ncbi:hypothetical protein CC80DRAFT_546030 [Byssothecium circinans]|uniref:Uncharacterized protein n=1 Tax=Byssothecium circinans TaxID=147558 RepID=A0A6A5U423_9PLEO|nr:hypothetical protein CC80DRAFT_546030 [Byssothecium circinans]
MEDPRYVNDKIETYAHKPETTAAHFRPRAASSHHSLHISRHTPSSAANSTSRNGPERYYSIEVPDHIDNRVAYGRRKTKDFGYPGARIKSRLTRDTHKAPLQDPSNWIKRACGHFSTIPARESREAAAKKPCSQCCKKIAVQDPSTSKQYGLRTWAATDSTVSRTSTCQRHEEQAHIRNHHPSDSVPDEKCGDVFAQSLGYIIDSILEEHQSTLQTVIDNIKFSQPNPEDLGQRCWSEDARSTASRSVCQRCQPSIGHGILVSQPHPCILPKAAERLNVGEAGQVGPNINDPYTVLRESIISVPEVIDLINSVADNLGVDLDRGPTPEDDLKFEQAPVERSHDALLQRKSNSTVYSQQDKHRSITSGSPPKQVHYCAIDSTVDVGPKMLDQQINEKQTSQFLTRISTGAIPPGTTQGWIETAQIGLPAAWDAFITVLDMLTALELVRWAWRGHEGKTI